LDGMEQSMGLPNNPSAEDVTRRQRLGTATLDYVWGMGLTNEKRRRTRLQRRQLLQQSKESGVSQSQAGSLAFLSSIGTSHKTVRLTLAE
jgi:hypothetical protein